MKATFDQVRAQYESDEQMARALLEQLQAAVDMVALEQALRRRAETMLQAKLKTMRSSPRKGSTE